MNDDVPIISVIIATYNYGCYIAEAIDSVLAQTYPQERIEIIVVDDGSTDDTTERIAKYQNKIKYYYKQNGGHASALNLGFQKSTGEIVTFLDPDDCWENIKLRSIADCYARFNAKTVFHNQKWFGEGIDYHQLNCENHHIDHIEKIEENLYKLTLQNIKYAKDFLVILSGQSYRREICEKIFPIHEAYRLCADFPIRNLALLHGDIYYFHNSLGRYRQHPKSHMAKMKNDINEQQFRIFALKLFLNILENRYSGREIKGLQKVYRDEVFYFGYALERRRGKKAEAFKYLCDYNPGNGFLEKVITYIKCSLFLLAPKSYEKVKQLIHRHGFK